MPRRMKNLRKRRKGCVNVSKLVLYCDNFSVAIATVNTSACFIGGICFVATDQTELE